MAHSGERGRAAGGAADAVSAAGTTGGAGEATQRAGGGCNGGPGRAQRGQAAGRDAMVRLVEDEA